MSIPYKDILAIWGAVLSSILGLIQLGKFIRDKAKISVAADLVQEPCDTNADVKGTKITAADGITQHVFVCLRVANSGSKALQIAAVVVDNESEDYFIQLVPEKLPALLEPSTAVEVTIQKEWLDGVGVTAFGVVDALGKRHLLSPAELQRLIARSAQYPSDRKKHAASDGSGGTVDIFLAKDKGICIRKTGR